ncbi:MAG: carbohydrate kinase family protein [Defluviitaleaceae bacterium]|nr:carbohydrate kinase family protein [Defluviitaleaceae bacterium]
MSGFRQAAANIRANADAFKIFAGLDGYVDEIIHVVEKRHGTKVDDYTRYEKIADYGQKIVEAGGLSANFEMMPIQVKLGGNGPIFANAMLGLGAAVTYCGKLGYPDIHPVFKPMADHPHCNVISRWNPAHTDALEFMDGKLIIGKMRVVYEITWESVLAAVGGIDQLRRHVLESGLIGMLNWTMLPFMDDILEGIIENVLPHIDKNHRPYFFFDIADPGKRTDDDIRKVLGIMVRLNKHFKVVLGLNEKEALRVASVLGVDKPENLAYDHLCNAMYGKLDIYCLVVHPVKSAFAQTADGYAHVKGPYCENPVLTTGAGDNFNAGFCLGLLCGLNLEEALMAGVSNSGFYVRNGRSAEIAELTEFMDSLEN